MKLRNVEFTFDEYTVSFVGDCVFVHETDDNNPVLKIRNPWRSTRKEDRDEVMGRQYKPRVTEAMDFIRKAMRERTKE